MAILSYYKLALSIYKPKNGHTSILGAKNEKKDIFTAAARRALVVIMSKCLFFFLYVFLYVCHVTFSRPLIGQKESTTNKERLS